MQLTNILVVDNGYFVERKDIFNNRLLIKINIINLCYLFIIVHFLQSEKLLEGYIA